MALAPGKVPPEGVAVSQEDQKDEDASHEKDGYGGTAAIEQGTVLEFLPEAHVKLSNDGIPTVSW